MDAAVTLLYAEIGRGHPFYLDGIGEELAAIGARVVVRDVFEATSGPSRRLWKLVRWLYRRGSSPGAVAVAYRRLRQNTDYHRRRLLLRLLGRPLAECEFPTPLIVAHPLLVAILAGRPGLCYQHGEVVTPGEALVRGAQTVFVPTGLAAEAFCRAGYAPDRVVVSGLCIEPALVRQAAAQFSARLARISNRPLTGAFFSSGAEPAVHVEQIAHAAVAVARTEGGAIIFAATDGALHRRALKTFSREGLPLRVVTGASPGDPPQSGATLALFASRAEEDRIVARLFGRFDYFVAPPHERTNWALGLGLPLFILGPDIGPFAPLNRMELLSAGVAGAIGAPAAAPALPRMLAAWQADGRLAAAARAGWGAHPTDGFARIASYLAGKGGGSAEA